MEQKNNDVQIINPIIAMEEGIVCRICLESEGVLQKICKCDGSIGYVHINCIETWIRMFPKDHFNRNNCNICYSQYTIDTQNIDERKIEKKDNVQQVALIFFLMLLFIAIIIIIFDIVI